MAPAPRPFLRLLTALGRGNVRLFARFEEQTRTMFATLRVRQYCQMFANKGLI